MEYAIFDDNDKMLRIVPDVEIARGCVKFAVIMGMSVTVRDAYGHDVTNAIMRVNE